MDSQERKLAFKAQAARLGKTANAAALEACGVTWFHLSEGLKDNTTRFLSSDVKQKFAAYIGSTVRDVFGDDASADAA